MLSHLFNVTHAYLRENVLKSVARDERWPSIRKQYLEKSPECEACKFTKALQVHHIVPFHEDPSKELEITNLITLCMGPNECHLIIGHGGSFKKYNPNVVKDAYHVLNHPNDMDSIKTAAIKSALPNDPNR